MQVRPIKIVLIHPTLSQLFSWIFSNHTVVRRVTRSMITVRLEIGLENRVTVHTARYITYGNHTHV